MSESLKQCAVVLSVGLRQSRTGGTTAPQRDRPCRCFGSEEHLSTRGPRLTFSPLALPAPMATPECAKDLPISRMTKPQLLQECLRLGLTVHHSWSPEEIKAIIMEAREKAKDQDATERMEADLPLEHARAQAEGDRTWCGVCPEHHQGQPFEASPRFFEHPGQRADEDWETQGGWSFARCHGSTGVGRATR